MTTLVVILAIPLMVVAGGCLFTIHTGRFPWEGR